MVIFIPDNFFSFKIHNLFVCVYIFLKASKRANVSSHRQLNENENENEKK